METSARPPGRSRRRVDQRCFTSRHAVTVDHPPTDVFDFRCRRHAQREWRKGVIEIERTSATGGEGATYRQVLAGPRDRRIDGDYLITGFDPHARLTFQVTAGPARPTGVFELTDDGAGATRVRFALDLQPTGLMRLTTSMITKQMRRRVAQLDNLKTILERRG